MIRYFTVVKCGVIYVIYHNNEKVKFHSYDSFPLEKTLTFHNVIILKCIFRKLFLSSTKK